MELTGLGRQQGGGATGPADASRLKFLEAVRLERERLEARVKLFLQSCDSVGEGGVSSRRAREYHRNVVLPHAMHG